MEDPWEMSVLGPEDEGDGDQERTPLNSPEKRHGVSYDGGGGAVGGGAASGLCGGSGSRARSMPTSAACADREAALARSATAMMDPAMASATDMRRSKLTTVLLALFCTDPLLDGLLLIDLTADDPSSLAVYGQSTRVLARIGQIIAIVFTLLLGLYSIAVLRRWQLSLPRFAAAAAAQFALLPEYKSISIVLDVGKLAYPSGARVPLVSLLMVVRALEVLLLLVISQRGGLRSSGLSGAKAMPEMLRTLVSLEGVEARGLADVAAAVERPLSVRLLERLLVFFAPRRLGGRSSAGAGLARTSAVPLTCFVALVAATTSVTEYERLFGTQEPLFDSGVATHLYDASLNESARVQITPPDAREPPPVSVVLLVLSGVGRRAGRKSLAAAFDKDVNPLCALDITSRCDLLRLRPVLPSTSVPNWIAATTGASPRTHGVLGNTAVGPFPFDSVFRQARRYGVHAGISAAPWFVNPVKPHLPPLDGDGRVSSAADGVYETTRRADTRAEDLRRRRTTLEAIQQNRESVAEDKRITSAPSRYALFVSHLSNADSIGHRHGTRSSAYDDAIDDSAQFVLEVMEALPPNSVLIVASDHGHEPSGGAGGVTDAVLDLPLYVYRKSVVFAASPLEIQTIATVVAKSTGRKAGASSASGGEGGASGGEASSIAHAIVSMEDLAPSLSLLAGVPTPRHSEGHFVPLLFENAQRSTWPAHARDLLSQRHYYASALLKLEALDGDGRLRTLTDIERDALATIGARGRTSPPSTSPRGTYEPSPMSLPL